MFNPYQPYMQNMQNIQMQQQVTRVNGENGAKAYPLNAPNSSVLLLDENENRLFLKVTDGAGYPTLTSYKLTPFTPEPEPDMNDLIKRIEKLERMVKDEKSNSANAKRKTESEQ